MKDLKFPIEFKFNISTLANDFTATDATGATVAYVRQKMFKLKEDITIYADESRTTIDYTIKADKWLDFSTAYSFSDAKGTYIGKIARKGWASLWKAKYEIIDQHDKLQYVVRENNAWTKVFDKILGEIPILSFFTGYLFNPSYSARDAREEVVVTMKKMPSFFGRKFELTKQKPIDNDDDDRIMLGLMMMILLERRRG